MNFERKCSVMGRKMKFGCLVKKGVAEVRERDLPEVGPYDVLLHMKYVISARQIMDSG